MVLSADPKKRKHSGSSSGSGPASLSSSPPTSSLLSSMLVGVSASAASSSPFDYSSASLPPSNPQKAAHFAPYADMGRDKAELKAAAATGPKARTNDPNQKIYKNQTMLKNAHKNVTVKMDDQRSRTAAAAAAGGIPIAPRNTQQQQQQRR